MTVRQRMIVKKVMVCHGGDLMADAHIEVNQVNEIPVVFQFFFFFGTRWAPLHVFTIHRAQ